MSYTFTENDIEKLVQFTNSETRNKKAEIEFMYCPICHGGRHNDKYTFSINKNTYTCNYSFEEVYKQKDGEDNLIYSRTTKDTIKVQVTMDGNDFKLVTYITHSEKREFEQEATFNGYKIKPGEYVEINGSDARVTIIKDAKVNLSLVDTTGFEILAW